MRKSRFTTAMALMSMALLWIIMPSCLRDKDAGGKVRHDLQLNELRDGDLLFRCGTSAESQAVVSLDKNKGTVYSHVGMAIKEGGVWMVVHAVPCESSDGIDRVKIEPVDTFFLTTRAVKGAAMRLSLCDAAAARKAAQWARAQCGVEFDDRYEWYDHSRLYCTELVQAAYESVGFDLASGHVSHVDLPLFTGDIVFPTDIASNDSLTTVFSF